MELHHRLHTLLCSANGTSLKDMGQAEYASGFKLTIYADLLEKPLDGELTHVQSIIIVSCTGTVKFEFVDMRWQPPRIMKRSVADVNYRKRQIT